jgi:hypothetical protein
MIRFIILLFSATLCVTAFGKGENTVKHGKQIDPKTKETIYKLNEQVCKYFADNDYPNLSKLFSDKLKSAVTQDFKDQFVPRVGSSMKGKKHAIFDEFEIQNNVPDSPVVVNGGTGEYEYTVNFIAEKGESYFVMLTVGDTVNEIMLSVLYHKNGEKWEVNILRAENYSLSKKNAVDLFEQARKLKYSGDLMDGLNILGAAVDCSSPVGQLFKYKIAEHLRDFADTLNFETKKKYTLPMKVEQVTTKPNIFNVHCELVEGQLVPIIFYQTSLFIKDTNALKLENEELHQKIGDIFTGMDKNNNMIIYRTYNDIPDGKTTPYYFNFIKKKNS